jgi:sec-independent protein translocase protein TatA
MVMGLSIWHVAVVAIVILVLFGRGRVSEMMGDFGKGISSFKKGMADDSDSTPAVAKREQRLEDNSRPAEQGVERASDDQTVR